ncbi:lytic transglycosylase domain-containing protein [Solilutibacter silvestris]|uniref:Transglycosylase SLT domain-containing protein n=1 Tax=Solilutibacter silvestris TaxID=1645665 RepID=A0A2K1PYQ6_9GAMM|nr:lytic transglycosylase domain-containing protein [Lysobacter silvestris]PNS07926.1 Transglycosylase SLT domain-containing protein [Lysobacter silvestris]
MLLGLELMGCPLAVPAQVMQHVVNVESSYNPYAIGVVGGHLARQPKTLPEALATVRMLEDRGYNFSLGLAQVNRYNLRKYGLQTYAAAFQPCANLKAGSQILAECNQRASGHWGKSFSCYYSGNFVTGYRQGYVQKIERSMWGDRVAQADGVAPIPVVDSRNRTQRGAAGARVAARGKAIRAAVIRNEGQLDIRSLIDRRGGVLPALVQAQAVPTQQLPMQALPAVAMPVMAQPVMAQPMQAQMQSQPMSSPTQKSAGDDAFVF